MIELGLTGGYDSRLAVSILNKICKKNDIMLKTYTGGADDHPDVIIAKKIAKKLNIPHEHALSVDKSIKTYPSGIKEYMKSFYTSQGDFDSNDYVHDYTRKIMDLTIMSHYGMDAYKRFNMIKLYSGNRWFARRRLFKNNFFFPLFYTETDAFFAKLNGYENYKDFIYEILLRSDPKLLKIEGAGDSLPQINIKPYKNKEDTEHVKTPFLWDYEFVKRALKPLLLKNLNKYIGFKTKLLLSVLGLNELDFFMNKTIYEIIKLHRRKKISLRDTIKKLYKEKKSKLYPKEKTMIQIKKTDEPIEIKTKRNMVILMDYASVAKVNSFKEIEKKLKL